MKSSKVSFIAAICLSQCFVTGTVSTEIRCVEQPDPMREHRPADWDRSGDRDCILYESVSDLEQGTWENWTSTVYNDN